MGEETSSLPDTSLSGAAAIMMMPAEEAEEVEALRRHEASIVVVDYHKGNLSSVYRAIADVGTSTVVTSDNPDEIRDAAGIVLPGVGSFYDAITFMAENGEAEAVRAAIAAGTPFLGICLGQQLLFERGDEGVPKDVPCLQAVDTAGSNLQPGDVFEAEGKRWVRGLGILKGSCTRLDGSRLKVPHVGWDQVHPTGTGAASPLLDGFPEGANMYFTHSYVVEGADPSDVIARTHYVDSFPCMVGRGNVFGCQFHPEKSSGRGRDILRRFVSIVRREYGADNVDPVILAAAHKRLDAAAAASQCKGVFRS